MYKIKAAQYFQGFETKPQKEQLEIVNDSRKPIEELISELKSILTLQSDAIPLKTKNLLENHIKDLCSENLFSRLNGLKKVLDLVGTFDVS